MLRLAYRVSHRKGCRSNKFHAASTKLRTLVCIPSPPIRCYVLLVLRRHLGDRATEVAGKGLAIAVELHEGVDVGFAFATAQWPVNSHVYDLRVDVSPTQEPLASNRDTLQPWAPDLCLALQERWCFAYSDALLRTPGRAYNSGSEGGFDAGQEEAERWAIGSECEACYLQRLFSRVGGGQGLHQDCKWHPSLLEQIAGARYRAECHPHVSGAAVASVTHDHWPLSGQWQLRPIVASGWPNLQVPSRMRNENDENNILLSASPPGAKALEVHKQEQQSQVSCRREEP